MFPRISPAFPLPHQFPLARYRGSFEETMLDQKTSIETIIQKLGLAETHPHEVLNWERFWESQPKELDDIQDIEAYKIPAPQNSAGIVERSKQAIQIDDGNREVQQVLHEGYSTSDRTAARNTITSILPQQMDSINQGDIVVVDTTPSNADWYKLPYLICEVYKDVSALDTTNGSSQIELQVLRPCGVSMGQPLEKKFIPWKGEDNKLWKISIDRKHIKGIVELTPRGRKLTKKSLTLLKNIHF